MRSIGQTPIRAYARLRARLLVAALLCGATPWGVASAASSGEILFASSFEDGEGGGGGWQVLEWPFRISYEATCALVRVYGIAQGDDFLFTTCVPPGYAGAVGSGDSIIVSVIDSLGADYIAANDDCDVDFVPQLTGWSCANTAAEVRMSCAPPDGEGVTVQPGATYLDVTICPYDPDDGVSPGSAPLHILWQGTSTPNPG